MVSDTGVVSGCGLVSGLGFELGCCCCCCWVLLVLFSFELVSLGLEEGLVMLVLPSLLVEDWLLLVIIVVTCGDVAVRCESLIVLAAAAAKVVVAVVVGRLSVVACKCRLVLAA